MVITRGISILLMVFAFATPATGQNGVLSRPDLALTGVRIINVSTGNVSAPTTVILSGGKISSLAADRIPAGAERIDLNGLFLLPGLMDAHTHLDTLAEARRALESGVTTVRSASVGSFRDVALRELVRAGRVVGPDILAAGIFVTTNLGDAVLADLDLAELSGGVNSLDELRKLVRINLQHDVDVIKTRGTERAGLPDTDPRKQVYSEAQLRAVVEEAARQDVPILCHAHGDEGARAAVKAGVRSIEHGTYLSDETLRLMKQRGTYLVPTYSTVVDLTEPDGDYDNPVLRLRGAHMLPQLASTVRRAHALGVPIVTGADTGYGPESLLRISLEVVAFSELGLSPLEALQSATLRAAELFRIEDRTGSLEVGKEADVIAVVGNPLQDIRTIQDVVLVISNGRVGLNRLPFAKN